MTGKDDLISRMKILFVAIPDSIHTARWIGQLQGCGWDIHLFPSVPGVALHDQIRDITVHSFFPHREKSGNAAIQPQEIQFSAQNAFKTRLSRYPLLREVPLLKPKTYKPAWALARLIADLKPHIIHSMEFQTSGYLTLEAQRKHGNPGGFPKWIATNWGSDIYLFGRLPEHQEKIRQVLAACNYYSCECSRDVLLAKELGFAKVVLPVFPNTGGFALDQVAALRQPGPPSDRKLILLKGYQTWAGRALVGLRALEKCAELLRQGNYEVAVYVPLPDVELAAALFTANTGVKTRIIPRGTPHQEMLRLHGQARISIGLSISDAISTSFLEAMAMGSFPVQSWTSCADEWVRDGETGLLVPPEDPEVVEQAIRRALTDDALVNRAAEVNYRTIAERAEYGALRQKTIQLYQHVYNH